jgi:hypothetical protein
MRPTGSVEGWCDSERHEIVVSDELALNARARVLVHELAHALGVGYVEFGHRRAEVIVDAVIFRFTRAVCGFGAGRRVPGQRGWAAAVRALRVRAL